MTRPIPRGEDCGQSCFLTLSVRVERCLLGANRSLRRDAARRLQRPDRHDRHPARGRRRDLRRDERRDAATSIGWRARAPGRRRPTVHAPLTRPSHVSLFSGLYPAEHGIRDNVAPTLGPRASRCLPISSSASRFRHGRVHRVCRARASIGTGARLLALCRPVRGNALTETRRCRRRRKRSRGSKARAASSRGCTSTIRMRHTSPRVPTQPGMPAGRTSARWPGRDELVGRLVDALRGAGTLEQTFVVVTSDHGEALGDHGEDMHGYFVYESTLRVPLVLRGPGVRPGTRLSGLARTVDLFPTVLDIAGLGQSAPASSGRSLAPALLGGPWPTSRRSPSRSCR